MSSSQKYQGYTIVPWYNSAEWQNVYTQVFSKRSTKDDLKAAMKTILTWQMRTPHLPSGVEGTLCILEALLIDHEDISKRQYQILCSSSIMRFLNICVAHRAQVYSFTRTVKDHCIPDWIINIRHNFAHSQKLPSISLLQLALKESFRWLEQTYWKPELKIMTDNIITGGNTTATPIPQCSLEMHELMELYCNLFVYDSLNLCYNEFIQDKLELVDASCKIDEYPNAILYLLDQGIENLGAYEWDKCIDEIMYSHFFIVKPQILIDNKGNCSKQYRNFGNLLNLLELHGKLAMLLKEMFYFCDNQREIIENREGVALWLDEIFKGMLKFRNKKFVGDLAPGIQFKQLHKETVQDIQKLKQLVFATVPERFQRYFIHNFLALVDIKDISGFIKGLNKRAAVPADEDVEDSMKLEENEREYETKLEIFSQSLSDSCESNPLKSISQSNDQVCNEVKPCKRWSLLSDTTAFESCAIGVLPTKW